MTWSIVARDEATGEIGIAVLSCGFAVGARVPFIASGVGAVATQSFVNPFYGYRGLELLLAGAAAEDVIRLLAAGLDRCGGGERRAAKSARRIDPEGAATHTGARLYLA